MQKKKVPAIELQTYAFDVPDTEDVIIRDELGANIKWATLPKLIEAFTSTKYGGKKNFIVKKILLPLKKMWGKKICDKFTLKKCFHGVEKNN